MCVKLQHRADAPIPVTYFTYCKVQREFLVANAHKDQPIPQ